MIFTNIAIASDHAGLEQKNAIKEWLVNQGCNVCDLGCNSTESTHYPIYAKKCAEAVVSGRAEVGVLVCGTGIGMQMAADKVKGIRAANITIPDFARLSREHNDANVITLSGRFIDLDTNKEILNVFLNTQASDSKNHVSRRKMIADMER